MEHYRLEEKSRVPVGVAIGICIFLILFLLAFSVLFFIGKVWIGGVAFLICVFTILWGLMLGMKQYQKGCAEFTVDEEKITVYPIKGESVVYFWKEIKDSGIFEVRVRVGRYSKLRKIICLSKIYIEADEKKRLSIGGYPQRLCIEAYNDAVFAIKKYYPLSTEVIRMF